MFIKQTIQVDDTALQRQQQALRQSPGIARTSFRRVTSRLKSRVLKQVRKEPPERSPNDPVNWTSDKQRMAFFATRGFGRGIPTVRSGALVKAWKVTTKRLRDGELFIIENLKAWAIYVVGSKQQRFHRDTGWPRADLVLENANQEAAQAFDITASNILSPSDPL